MGRNQQKGNAREAGTQPYANATGRSQCESKTIDSVTALGLGATQQNTMRSGVIGLQGLAQPSSLNSVLGSTGLNPLAGGTGANAALSTANSKTGILQLATFLGGSQQQSVTFQPAQLLQVRQALAQQHDAQVTATQAALAKPIEAAAQKKSELRFGGACKSREGKKREGRP